MNECCLYLPNLETRLEMLKDTKERKRKMDEEKKIYMKEFGTRLARLLDQKGVTISQLSHIFCINCQSIYRWLNAQSLPELPKLIVLAKICGCSTDYLLGYEKDEQKADDKLEDEQEEELDR